MELRDTTAGVFRWVAVMLALACLLAFASRAGAVQSFEPLRSYVESLGTEFVLGTVGDSWTCNNSQDGETKSWGSDLVGSVASYEKNLIWADNTSSHSSIWTSRLAYRLKTHKYVSESVGGALLCNTGVPFSFKEDSSICGWIDDLAKFNPKVVVGFGGINNMMNYGSIMTWETAKVMQVGWAKRLLDQIPAPVPIILPTLMPCSLNPMRYKKAGTAGWTALTWTQIGDKALEIQAIESKWNTHLLDTLKTTLASAGYDTTRLYVWDLHPNIVQTHTWSAGSAASLYPLTLGNGANGLPGATQADSIKWAALNFPRYAITSDSIHINNLGNRQFGDSLAREVFGVDFSTWVAGAPATIYVNKQAGDNWGNRILATAQSTPLASIQCAIWRAWPGDSICVYGPGNQALISGGYSVNTSEFYITKPGLRIGIVGGAYYGGGYNISTGKGIGMVDYVNNSGGDGKELPNTIKTFPTTGIAGVNYPVIDLDIRITGLLIRGYHDQFRLANVSDITMTDCDFRGGNGTGGFYDRNYGDDLTVNLTRCIFHADSNSHARAGGNGNGRAHLTAAVAADSSRFFGTIRECTFYGLAAHNTAPALSGYVDGMSIVANTFSDPAPYQYGWITYERSSGTLNDVKLLHNKFVTAATTEVRVAYSARTAIDSLIVVGNLLYMPGVTPHASTYLYRGPYTASRAWIDGNIVSSASTAINAGGSAKTIAALVSDGSAAANRNWPVHISLTGDTLIFGARARSYFHGSSTLWYGLPAYNISTGAQHASIGPTQYTGDPIVWSGNATGRQGYQDMSPWKLLKLINAGVLWPVTAANGGTYYEIPRVYNESDATMVEGWFDAWRNWPTATRAKIQYLMSGTTSLIKSADSTYVGPAQLIASLAAGHESACDSTNSSTWFRFTRPYNLTDKLQIMHWLDYMETQTDTTRRKFRFAVDGTDLSWFSPATGTSYANGMWQLYSAIGTTETASDSLAADNWFALPRVRPKEYAQAVQNRIYTRTLAVWPESKRKQVRVRTK